MDATMQRHWRRRVWTGEVLSSAVLGTSRTEK
jgi:hypothetical protein